MTFLVRCPASLCKAPKRIDPPRYCVQCPRCGAVYVASPPERIGDLGYACEGTGAWWG